MMKKITLAVAALAVTGAAFAQQGMKPEDAIKKLKGIRCGYKSTSCPDQLARALESMQQQ